MSSNTKYNLNWLLHLSGIIDWVILDQCPSMLVWRDYLLDVVYGLREGNRNLHVATWDSSEPWMSPNRRTDLQLHAPTISADVRAGEDFPDKNVLLITDFVSNSWSTGIAGKVWRSVGKRGTVAIASVFPEGFRERTALSNWECKLQRIDISASGLSPKSNSNIQGEEIISKSELAWLEIFPEPRRSGINHSIILPILWNDEILVNYWRDILNGGAGIVLDFRPRDIDPTTVKDEFPPPESDEVQRAAPEFKDACRRVMHFHSLSSQKTYRLAVRLAVAPSDLDTMFMILKELEPEADILSLAEIVSTGLMQYVVDDNRYEFIDKVRDVLIDSLPINKGIDTIDFVCRIRGYNFSFIDWLNSPGDVIPLIDADVAKHAAMYLLRCADRVRPHAEILQKIAMQGK